MVLTLSDGTPLVLVGPIRRSRKKGGSYVKPIIASLDALADSMAAERKAATAPVPRELVALDEAIADGDVE